MRRIETIAQLIAEELFNNSPDPFSTDEKYLVLINKFYSVSRDVEKFANDSQNTDEIRMKMLDLESICSEIEKTVLNVSFAQGIIYGIGLKNQMESINLNEF